MTLLLRPLKALVVTVVIPVALIGELNYCIVWYLTSFTSNLARLSGVITFLLLCIELPLSIFRDNVIGVRPLILE